MSTPRRKNALGSNAEKIASSKTPLFSEPTIDVMPSDNEDKPKNWNRMSVYLKEKEYDYLRKAQTKKGLNMGNLFHLILADYMDRNPFP